MIFWLATATLWPALITPPQVCWALLHPASIWALQTLGPSIPLIIFLLLALLRCFFPCHSGSSLIFFLLCSSVQDWQSFPPQHAAGQFAPAVFLLGDLLNMVLQKYLKRSHSKWPGLGLESAASLKINLLFTELLLSYVSRCGHWIHIAGQFSLFYWKRSQRLESLKMEKLSLVTVAKLKCFLTLLLPPPLTWKEMTVVTSFKQFGEEHKYKDTLQYCYLWSNCEVQGSNCGPLKILWETM